MHIWAGWSTAALVRALVRTMLLAGVSVAGFVLFSLLAGPAHADSPGDEPAPTGSEFDLDGLLDLEPLPDLPEPEPEPREPAPEPREPGPAPESEPLAEPKPAPKTAPEPEPAPAPAPAPAPEAEPETQPEVAAEPGAAAEPEAATEPEAAAEPEAGAGTAGRLTPVTSTVDAVVAATEEEIGPLLAGEVLPVLEPVTEPVDQLLVLVADTVETTVSSLEPLVEQVVATDPLAGVVSMVLDVPEFAERSEPPADPATTTFPAEPVRDRSAQAVPLPPPTGPPTGLAADRAGPTGPPAGDASPVRLNGSAGFFTTAVPAPGGGVCHLDGAANDTGPPVPGATPCTSSIPPFAGALRIPDQLPGSGLVFSISPLPG